MVYTFKRGTHPAGNKEHTKDKSIEVLKAPEYVVLPVSMHIGAPATVIVKHWPVQGDNNTTIAMHSCNPKFSRIILLR